MTYLGLDDPQKRAIPFLPSAIGARAGGTSHSCEIPSSFLSFFIFIYFFIVDITQSHLYTYHIIITTKTCDISNKDLLIYNKST